jgi:hypothetical protein
VAGLGNIFKLAEKTSAATRQSQRLLAVQALAFHLGRLTCQQRNPSRSSPMLMFIFEWPSVQF